MRALPTDQRSTWDETLLADRRVLHFWDAENVGPNWFGDSANIDLGGGGSGFLYDAYLLFGPQAKWGRAPAPLVGSGVTVIGTADELARELRSLLASTLK